VGKGYHTDEKVIGFYNLGDRIRLWGKNGAFWGGLWGLFASGLLMTVPFIGPVVVLSHLGIMLIGAASRGMCTMSHSLIIGVPRPSECRCLE
jgi:hypothetical protein